MKRFGDNLMTVSSVLSSVVKSASIDCNLAGGIFVRSDSSVLFAAKERAVFIQYSTKSFWLRTAFAPAWASATTSGLLRLSFCGIASMITPPPTVRAGDGLLNIKRSPGPAVRGRLNLIWTRHCLPASAMFASIRYITAVTSEVPVWNLISVPDLRRKRFESSTKSLHRYHCCGVK